MLDEYIETLRQCKYLPENDLKKLCQIVRPQYEQLSAAVSRRQGVPNAQTRPTSAGLAPPPPATHMARDEGGNAPLDAKDIHA